MKKLSLFATLTFGFLLSYTASSRPSQDLVNQSLEHLASRAGVEPQVLANFWAAFKSQVALAPDANTEQPMSLCSPLLEPSESARNSYLECLASSDLQFNESVFAELLGFRSRFGSGGPSLELEKTLGLLSYLEDLARAQIHAQGQPAAWFTMEQGFLKGSGYLDFEFQNGDIVLGLGNSSLSSLISQITDPKSRYSHAFLVKKTKDGKITTIESLVETGVKEFPVEHLLKDHYNQLTVLRWKNDSTRENAVQRAMAFAQAAADRRLKYDSSIDLDDDKKMFCTELVAKAYVEGAGVPMNEVLPSLARITNERVFRFVSKLGVTNRDVVSPGDLMNSPHFEVVADWRRSDDLFRSWELYLMGDLLLTRIASGWTLKSDPALFLMPLPILLLQTLPGLLSSDLRLLPESIGPQGFATMATTELHIYRPAIGRATDLNRGGQVRSLISTAPWELRAGLDDALARNRASRTYLKAPR